MKPLQLFLSALLLALANFAHSGPALAQVTDPPMEKSLSFRVVIGPDGKLVTATPADNVLGADIQRAALGLVKELKFEPAQFQGKPASAETLLRVTVQFNRQADGSFRLGLKSARLVTEATQQVPPVYQSRRGKTAASFYLMLGLVVLPDGSVDPKQVQVLHSAVDGGPDEDLARMTKASIESISKWKFRPDLVAGQPVSTMIWQGMRFCGREIGSCDRPVEPAPTQEMQGMPRSMSPDAVLPRLPQSLAARRVEPQGETSYPQLRIVVDAQGVVISALRHGKDVPAPIFEAARQKLLASRFIPAQSAGRAVPSEMTVTLPVRDEGAGGLRVLVERINYDFQLVAESFPWISPQMSANRIDARTRYRVVIGPDGKADMSQSKIEMLELSPNGPGIRRQLQANLLEAISSVRVEPVLVDGKPVSISFTRGMYFCSDRSRACAFNGMDDATVAAIRKGAELPVGVSLASLFP